MTGVPRRWRLRLYALECWYELVKQLRMPMFVVFALGFPVMFYIFFGVLFGRGSAPGGGSLGTYYIATYGAFSVISSALFGFGGSVATERGQGWMLLKRASPMPPEAYFIAKLAVSLLFALTIVVLLTICGMAFVGVRVSLPIWSRLAATLVAGAVPFCALGLAIGYWAGPNSAVGVVNLINLPMAIVSGLWMPIEMLPAFARGVAPLLPPYHYSQLALATLGAGRSGSPLGHALVLVGFSGLCLTLAYAGYLRDEGKTYG
jgi:ABC-2 type transport system permease protein